MSLMIKINNTLKNTIIFLGIMLYYYLTMYQRNQYLYNMSYFNCILFMILLSFILYTYGIIKNNNKCYKTNIRIYIFLFLILLFSFTFVLKRAEFRFYNRGNYIQYIPFKTILSQFKYGTFLSILKNIVGNSIALIPLSFLLMIENKKYNNFLKQTYILLPIILGIELLQNYTHTGSFDVDDIILNYLGVILFTFLITKFNLLDKVRKLFYTDFNLKEKSKLYLFYTSFLLLICYILFILIIK